MKDAVLSCIRTRRSAREFEPREVPPGMVEELLDAARWTQSGMNNQPWRVVVVTSPDGKEALAPLSGFPRTVHDAGVLLAVFLDGDASYDRTKDVQGCGAFCQTALLAAHAMGLGGVWNGRILAQKERVAHLLEAPPAWELMAVLCIGWPVPRERTSDRKSLSDICCREKAGRPWGATK